MAMLWSMISKNFGSRWPTTGRDRAWSTRGFTGLGPGPSSVRIGGLALGAADMKVTPRKLMKFQNRTNLTQLTVKTLFVASRLLFVFDEQFHAADFLDGAVQTVAIMELAYASRGAGRD